MPSRDTGSGGIGGVVMPSSVFKNASDDWGRVRNKGFCVAYGLWLLII